MSRVQLNDAHPNQRLKIARLQIELRLQRPQRLLRVPALILRDSGKKVSSRNPWIEFGRMFQRMARVSWLTFAQLSHAKPQISVRKHGGRCDDSLKLHLCRGCIAPLQSLRTSLKLLLQRVRLLLRLGRTTTHERPHCQHQQERRRVADSVHTVLHVIPQTNGKREPLFGGSLFRFLIR